MPASSILRGFECFPLFFLFLHQAHLCDAFLPWFAPNQGVPFNWTAISPSSDIIYHECYGNLECARLELPLEWQNVSNPNTISLAIARLPAKVSVTDDSFGGTIILNPGGPSGSGITFLQSTGEALQTFVDGQKHYEMLSFDPRGVYHTKPDAHCLVDSLDRQIFGLKYEKISNGLDSGMQAFHERWSFMKMVGVLCADEEVNGYNDGANIRQYMSTASVARDILAIVDKVHEHRNAATDMTDAEIQQEPEIGRLPLQVHLKAEEPPLLQYWGFSYGSYLGNTFASLYPSRIGRMILDGVVDAPDYAATGWSKNLQDVQKTLDTLYQYCFDGKEKCALYSDTDASPSDIRDRVDDYLGLLKKSPIPVSHDGHPELITYTDVNAFLFVALYAPFQAFPLLAKLLSDLMGGKPSSFLPFLPSIVPPQYCTPANLNSTLPELYDYNREVQQAILCGDGVSISNTSKADFQSYISRLTSQSTRFGGMWSNIRLSCTGWPDSLRPKWRFAGPFASSASNYSSRASPILFIGNTADPVTPVRNAHAMAARHEGSLVLTLDSPGHCSFLANPNQCARTAISAYLADGILPEKGTVCGSDQVPWDDGKSEAVLQKSSWWQGSWDRNVWWV